MPTILLLSSPPRALRREGLGSAITTPRRDREDTIPHAQKNLPLPHLRLARDPAGKQSAVDPADGFGGVMTDDLSNICGVRTVDLQNQLHQLRRENDMLRAEVSHLRSRDDTVKDTMHRID